MLLARTKAAPLGHQRGKRVPQVLPHFCQLLIRVGGCHQPLETSPCVRGRGSGLAARHGCWPVLRSHSWPGAVLWSEPSPFTGGHMGLVTPDRSALAAFGGGVPPRRLISGSGPCSRPRPPLQRKCLVSSAVSSPARCPVASGSSAASSVLSSGPQSGRRSGAVTGWHGTF